MVDIKYNLSDFFNRFIREDEKIVTSIHKKDFIKIENLKIKNDDDYIFWVEYLVEENYITIREGSNKEILDLTEKGKKEVFKLL